MTSRYSRRRLVVISGGAVLGGAALTPLNVHGIKAQTPEAETEGLMRALEPDPQRGGTLTTAWSATVPHYDVHQGASSAVLTHLYDTLVARDIADGLRSIIPSLATDWEVSSDQTAYTFPVRPDVTFHDGTPFTAEDVVATFNRILSPPEGIVSVYANELGPVATVEAVDPMTVRFVLEAPWPPFLEALASPYMVVYSKQALDENANDLRRVVAPGTGPFVFVENLQGEKWVFERKLRI